MSPCAGAWTPLPHDARLHSSGTPAYTADGTFEAGYRAGTSAGAVVLYWNMGYSVTLGIGDTIYATIEANFGATTWAPGANENLLEIGASATGRIGITRASTGTVTAYCLDANGTYHRTATWTPTASTHYVLGVSVKRYTSGANTVVDVVLYDVDGTTSGGTPVALATLTADVIAGADKTIAIDQNVQMGLPTTFGKSGTGEFRWGTCKINVSSAVVLSPTGSAWTQAAVDQVRTSLLNATGSARTVTAIGLITVYDTSASGDGWPTVSTVIDWRLPTANETPLAWTPSAGTNYACVDDALGSFSATDYVSVTSSTAEDQYSYPALSLSGKTVLAVGIQIAFSGGSCSLAANVNGTLTAYLTVRSTIYQWAWWDKVTVGSGFPAAGGQPILRRSDHVPHMALGNSAVRRRY